jgi:antitoxin ParD1/3/4
VSVAGLPIFAKLAKLPAMGTMNISLPDSMKEFIDGQVADKGYGTSSEYVRDLIRREQDREKLRTLILEGAASPLSPVVADEAYFQGLRARARRWAAESAAGKGKTGTPARARQKPAGR